MSLVRFKGKNHPQQIAAFGVVDMVDDRATTPEVFDPLHARYGFTIDVAAAAHNTKCERFYDRVQDGLVQPWAGERVWCNPPYSKIAPWVEKAWAEEEAPVIVMLLPANRTEQHWWHDWVEPRRDQPGSPLRVEFILGRVRFLKPGADEIKPNERPPFGSCLLVWDRQNR